MKIKKLWVASVALVAAAGLIAVAVAAAGAQVGSYQIDWWVVAGGGGSSGSEVGYQLSGVAGQPASGPLIGGEGYGLNSGYWVGLMLPTGYEIYLPAVLRG